jgi:hypothetical protein
MSAVQLDAMRGAERSKDSGTTLTRRLSRQSLLSSLPDLEPPAEAE